MKLLKILFACLLFWFAHEANAFTFTSAVDSCLASCNTNVPLTCVGLVQPAVGQQYCAPIGSNPAPDFTAGTVVLWAKDGTCTGYYCVQGQYSYDSCDTGGTWPDCNNYGTPPPCSISDPTLLNYAFTGVSADLMGLFCESSCTYTAFGVSLCTSAATNNCLTDLTPTGQTCGASGATLVASPLSTTPVDPSVGSTTAPSGTGGAPGGSTTLPADGSSGPVASTGTSSMAQFCVDNPTASICQSGSVSGNCATFKCTGDPVQCQQAADLEAIRCQGLVNQSTPTVAQVGGDYTRMLNELGGLQGLQDSIQDPYPENPGLWAVSDYLPLFVASGSCSDYSFTIASQTFVLPLSQVGNFFPLVVQWMVNVLTAFTVGHVLLAKPKTA